MAFSSGVIISIFPMLMVMLAVEALLATRGGGCESEERGGIINSSSLTLPLRLLVLAGVVVLAFVATTTSPVLTVVSDDPPSDPSLPKRRAPNGMDRFNKRSAATSKENNLLAIVSAASKLALASS